MSQARPSGLWVLVPGAALAAAPLAGLALVGLVLASAIGLALPGLSIAALAGIITTNLADIAVNRHGLPPIGALVVPGLFGVLLVRWLWGRETLSANVYVGVAAALYLTLSALPLLWLAETAPTLQYLDDLARNLLVVFVFVGFLSSLDRLRLVVATIAVCALGLAALSLVQVATGTYTNNYLGFANASIRQIAGELRSWRISGPLPDSNYYAQLLVVALPLLAVQVLAARAPLLRLMGLLGTPLIVAVIVLTYSRGGLLALGVQALVVLALLRNRLTAMAVLLILAAVGLASGEVTQRIEPAVQALVTLAQGSEAIADAAIQQRLAAQTAAVAMFLDHPLTGVGYGQFPHRFQEYALSMGLNPMARPYPHNLYFEVAAEGGLLGLLSFLSVVTIAVAMAGTAVRRLYAAGRNPDAMLVQALIVSFVGYLATAVFLHGAYPRLLWMQVALLISSGAATMLASRHDPTADAKRRTTMPSSPSFPGTAREAFARYWFVILLVAMTFGGVAGYRAATTPRLFQAEADLLYRFGREYFPISPGEQRRNWGENIIVSLEEALFTEASLIQSSEVQRAVVEALDAQDVAFVPPRPAASEGDASSPPAAPEGSPKAERVTALAEMIEVNRADGTTLLTVGARNADPAVADVVLDTYLATYLEHRQRLFNPDPEGFFADQMARARAEQEALDAQVLDLYAAAEVTDLESERELARDRLVRLEDRERASAVAGTTSADAQQARDRLAALNRLQDELAPLEARREALLSHLRQLEEERQSALLTASYLDSIGPAIEVVDREFAADNPLGGGAVPRVLGSALLGFLIASLLAIGGLLLRRPASDPAQPEARPSNMPPAARARA